MDTLFYAANRERILNSFIISSIMGMLLFTQTIFINPPIYADDIKIAQISEPSVGLDTGQIKDKILNEFSMETRAKNFDEKIKRKYPKATIVDVDSGVKHIKVTKYYDGRPVRINIFEIDIKLADDF